MFEVAAKERTEELKEMPREERIESLTEGKYGVDKIRALELVSGDPEDLLKHVVGVCKKEQEDELKIEDDDDPPPTEFIHIAQNAVAKCEQWGQLLRSQRK